MVCFSKLSSGGLTGELINNNINIYEISVAGFCKLHLALLKSQKIYPEVNKKELREKRVRSCYFYVLNFTSDLRKLALTGQRSIRIKTGTRSSTMDSYSNGNYNINYKHVTLISGTLLCISIAPFNNTRFYILK